MDTITINEIRCILGFCRHTSAEEQLKCSYNPASTDEDQLAAIDTLVKKKLIDRAIAELQSVEWACLKEPSTPLESYVRFRLGNLKRQRK